MYVKNTYNFKYREQHFTRYGNNKFVKDGNISCSHVQMYKKTWRPGTTAKLWCSGHHRNVWHNSHNWSIAFYAYELLRRDRRGRRGGGEALYIREAFFAVGIETSDDEVGMPVGKNKRQGQQGWHPIGILLSSTQPGRRKLVLEADGEFFGITSPCSCRGF